MSSHPSPQSLKAAIAACEFYSVEQPSMPPPRKDTCWVDGGLCPFHDDHHRGNFRVHLESGAFVCFSCGTKGSDIIDYTRLRYNLDFPATLEAISRAWGVPT
jgi:CHC2-type zinc finger protein